MPNHLKKLPPKSFNVAPGDVIGGLIYVMDKPLGIEEGMVGISLDSEPYRAFVKETYLLLEQLRKGEKHIDALDNKEQITPLYQRYQTLYQAQNGFANKSEKDIIDALLLDKVHEKKRHGASWKEFKNVFFSLSKYHEMKGLQSYYVNKGTGGLLFESYKNKCGIKKKDGFATHIGKLIKDGNKAYMIKQDGEMALGGTGPGWRKMLKTNTGKILQRLVNPWIILFTGGLSAIAFGIGMLGWRGYYLSKNKPAVSNADAIIEATSTKMASKRGVTSQEINTIEGTYTNGMPKVATIVTWSPGCRDLSDKLKGSTDFSSVVVTWDKNEKPVKVDANGHILRTKDKNDKGEITSYEKVIKGGKVLPCSKAEYDNAKMVSDDTIAGLGESLITFISMGDRDGIGKAGQNKAIMPLEKRMNNQRYQFFGIDFGKAYKQPNPIVASLRDDFSFDNPSSRQSRFVNYSMLYDNPLRDKMKGVYLLGALRGKLSDEQKEVVAKEYEASGDKLFADKLRTYPASQGGLNCDIKIIEDEINKYEALANDPQSTQVQKEQYLHYAQRLKDMKKVAVDTDTVILDKFEARLNLTPTQIDLLDNIEKLTAKAAHTASPDGKVQLNHLRVEREDRAAWQLLHNNDDTFTLWCEETTKQNEIKQRLLALSDPAIDDILNRAIIEKGKLMLKDLTKNEIKLLSQHITEENVAKTRHLPLRTQAMRDSFHHRLKMADKPQVKKDKVIRLGPRQFDNPIVSRHDNHLSFMYRSGGSQMAKHVTPVLTLNGANLQDIAQMLSKEENQLRYNIVDVKSFEMSALRHNQGIAITLKDPTQNKEARVFLEQTPQGVRFNYPNTLSLEDFALTSKVLSPLVAKAAKPDDEIEIAMLNDRQKELIEAQMKEGIQVPAHLKGDHHPRLDR